MKAGDALLTPAPDFSTPLELLHACHGRIEAQCATLMKLPSYLLNHGADAQVQQAATAVLRYFSTAARHHHEDEEQDIFPMVRAHAATAGNDRMRVLLDNLIAQHRDMEAAWNGLRPWLESLARGESPEFDASRITAFFALYQAHILHEEQGLLPYCRAALKPEQLAVLGEHMARRRGVDFSGDAIV